MLAVPVKKIIEHLQSRIIGQPEAIETIEEFLTVAGAGISDPFRPLGILFFTGPTGVGKSATAVALAEAIHGREWELYLNRIDCEQLKEYHTVSSLTGSPPGYYGSIESDTLLIQKKIEGKLGQPGILVFEEFEKADPAVWDTLLGIADNGTLSLSNGKKSINFRNCMIILTSNIGSREIQKELSEKMTGFSLANGHDGLKKDATFKRIKSIVNNKIKDAFKPELINRFDGMVVFDYLTKQNLISITDNMLHELEARLMAKSFTLSFKNDVLDFLAETGYSRQYGARELRRTIGKHVQLPLAKAINEGPSAWSDFNLVIENNAVKILKKDGDDDKVKALCLGRLTKILESERAKANERVIRLKLDPAESWALFQTIEAFHDPQVADYLTGLTEADFKNVYAKLADILKSLEDHPDLEKIKPKLFTDCVLYVKGVYSPHRFYELVMGIDPSERK